ncbi:NIPSNAP family protein [Streptomyces sp. NPDC060194]|uniref:NIPSNAP family protein n=1 Tax=Streptomyces sp. NPDC060194 TaxID=3347069 RepID=UPI003664E1A1
MITGVVRYVIDPAETEAFERFGRRWMELVDRHGGTHHGYFLPGEGAGDEALALFSFPSLAAYEEYRALFGRHPDFVAADAMRDESGCVLRSAAVLADLHAPDASGPARFGDGWLTCGQRSARVAGRGRGGMRRDGALELPPCAERLVGRDAEVRALTDALTAPAPTGRTGAAGPTGPRGGAVLPPRPGSGPVTGPAGRARTAVVSGVAGVGKSALALRVAHASGAEFPDGRVYLRLGGARRPLAPGRALAALLHGLGAGTVPAEDGAAARQLRDRLAGTRTLLVLDDAESAAQVRPLLPDERGCAVVVTSREPLPGLIGAVGLRLGPLTAAAGEELLGVAGAEQLACACGGLPLALRLAAARLAARDAPDPHALAAQLADEAAHVGRPGRDDAGLHGPLTVAASALSAESALALRRIGALALPWYGAGSAARLMGATDERAVLALEGLARAGLVEPAGPGRFAPHDLVRAFAGEPAPGRDGEAAADRVLRWCTARAREAALVLLPPGPDRDRRLTGVLGDAEPFADADAALAWADAELPVLTALAEERAARAPGQVLALIRCVVPYLQQRLLQTESAWMCELAVGTAQRLGDPGAEAQARVDLATARHLAGRTDEARVLVAEAEELRAGDPNRSATSHTPRRIKGVTERHDDGGDSETGSR